jgi:hypothetical protein
MTMLRERRGNDEVVRKICPTPKKGQTQKKASVATSPFRSFVAALRFHLFAARVSVMSYSEDA